MCKFNDIHLQRTANSYLLFVSNQSQRIDTGSADVDWSNWGEEWAESHDHDNQSDWTDWSNAQLTTANSNWNHSTSDKSSKSRKPTTKPVEKNLIDFDFSDDRHHGDGVATETVGDGWDAEVWADIDDDNWEPLDTPPATSGGKHE